MLLVTGRITATSEGTGSDRSSDARRIRPQADTSDILGFLAEEVLKCLRIFD
jgi:hypothetical protein